MGRTVQGETGIADFGALQDDLAAGRSERMVYCAFDLLYLDGFDLRKAPLIERKRVLAALPIHVVRLKSDRGCRDRRPGAGPAIRDRCRSVETNGDAGERRESPRASKLMPVIWGQHQAYLVREIGEFKVGNRANVERSCAHDLARHRFWKLAGT